MNIGNEINTVINNLAEKLGVISTQILEMYTKQARVDGIKSIVSICVSISLIAIVGYVMHKMLNKRDKDGDRRSQFWDEWEWGWFMALSYLTILILLIIVFVNISRSINCFVNPEYYAFKKIMSDIGNIK